MSNVLRNRIASLEQQAGNFSANCGGAPLLRMWAGVSEAATKEPSSSNGVHLGRSA